MKGYQAIYNYYLRYIFIRSEYFYYISIRYVVLLTNLKYFNGRVHMLKVPFRLVAM